jgi:hypothetical protein
LGADAQKEGENGKGEGERKSERVIEKVRGNGKGEGDKEVWGKR